MGKIRIFGGDQARVAAKTAADEDPDGAVAVRVTDLGDHLAREVRREFGLNAWFRRDGVSYDYAVIPWIDVLCAPRRGGKVRRDLEERVTITVDPDEPATGTWS